MTMGRTVTDFVIESAYEAARRVLAGDDSLVLCQQALQAFTPARGRPATATFRTSPRIREV